MSSNDHTIEAAALLNHVQDRPPRSMQPADMAHTLAVAQVHATLAVTHEQRTANLIAFLAWDTQPTTLNGDQVDLMSELRARLGLDGGDQS